MPSHNKRNHNNKLVIILAETNSSHWENNRTLIVKPFFPVETYLLLKNSRNNFERVSYIKTRSPEKYENFYTSSEVLNFEEYKSGIVVFYDMLDFNQKAIDPCFPTRRHKKFDVYCLSKAVLIHQKSIRK